MLDNMGIKLDTTSSKTLHDSLIEMCGTDFTSSARAQILVSLCSKPMQVSNNNNHLFLLYKKHTYIK